MDNDTPGVAERTLRQIRTWPPGLPVFGLLTPLPATPLYKKLEEQGRLTRPKHWQEFLPFAMAHTPLKMSIEEAHDELQHAWAHSYSPEAITHAVNSLGHKEVGYRINILVSRLCFRGIYFPQMGPLAWLKVIAQNWQSILQVIKDGFGDWCNGFKKNRVIPSIADRAAMERLGYAYPPPDANTAAGQVTQRTK
jgi:Domain of unknown function (DUF4070)